MRNEIDRQNPFTERARQAAMATDELVPIDAGMMRLMRKAIPGPGDRAELRALIEKINGAEDQNRRNALLLQGLLQNSNAVCALLAKLARWL